MEILIIIIAVIIIGMLIAALATYLYILNQGNCNIQFFGNSRSEFKIDELTQDSIIFSTLIRYENNGGQNGTIVDLFPRHLLPQEQFDAVKVESWLFNTETERHDGYWEAIIVKKGQDGTITLNVKLTAKNGDIINTLENMVDMPIHLVYQVVGRSWFKIYKERIIMYKDEVKQAIKTSIQKEVI